jgi:hypothetical protein
VGDEVDQPRMPSGPPRVAPSGTTRRISPATLSLREQAVRNASRGQRHEGSATLTGSVLSRSRTTLISRLRVERQVQRSDRLPLRLRPRSSPARSSQSMAAGQHRDDGFEHGASRPREPIDDGYADEPAARAAVGAPPTRAKPAAGPRGPPLLFRQRWQSE